LDTSSCCMFYHHCGSHFYMLLCFLFMYDVRLSYHNKRLLTYLLTYLLTFKRRPLFTACKRTPAGLLQGVGANPEARGLITKKS